MAHTLTISDETFARLQRFAVPLVDTSEMVINKALDALVAAGGKVETSSPKPPKEFDSAAAPSLTHTKVLKASLLGSEIVYPDNNWNGLMLHTIKAAFEKLKDRQAVANLVVVNKVLGKKEVEGFKYLPEIGISVQGQDSNKAWKAIHHIANSLGFSVEVVFAWYENPKAAHPGAMGRLLVKGE